MSIARGFIVSRAVVNVLRRDFDIGDRSVGLDRSLRFRSEIVRQHRVFEVLCRLGRQDPRSGMWIPLLSYELKLTYAHTQTIEVDRKTKVAITQPEPIGVCGQMSVPVFLSLFGKLR